MERHLLKDIMQSTKPWIEELMTAGYKVIVISEKNNIRDGGSTALQTTDTVHTVHTAYAVYKIETALRC